jgi:hypothetical protein
MTANQTVMRADAPIASVLTITYILAACRVTVGKYLLGNDAASFLHIALTQMHHTRIAGHTYFPSLVCGQRLRLYGIEPIRCLSG